MSLHMMFVFTDRTQLLNMTDMVAEPSSTVMADTEVATVSMLSLKTMPEKCEEQFLVNR